MATPQRWLRVIPVALVMYTISYLDRTNVSLALDGRISTMLRDLDLNDQRKGTAAGVFFLGYFMLQAVGGYIAERWSARALISICLGLWGLGAVACGMAHTYHQFLLARFCLGLAESSVFPATMVLLGNWFPTAERVRATAIWCVCQPIAVVLSAPITGWCLGACGWRVTLVAEGLLPIVWVPIWWLTMRDRPREASWVPAEERDFLESTIAAEAAALEPPTPVSFWRIVLRREVCLLCLAYILYVSAAYGCMTFFTTVLKERSFSGTASGLLFAAPYLLTAVVMVAVSWSSDRTRERRGHAALVLGLSGVCLIGSVLAHGHFWLAYVLMCFSIPGPFSALGPFFAIPAEIFPRRTLGPLLGVLNSVGNLGGFIGPSFIGWLATLYHSTAVPFIWMGVALLLSGSLALLMPKTQAVLSVP